MKTRILLGLIMLALPCVLIFAEEKQDIRTSKAYEDFFRTQLNVYTNYVGKSIGEIENQYKERNRCLIINYNETGDFTCGTSTGISYRKLKGLLPDSKDIVKSDNWMYAINVCTELRFSDDDYYKLLDKIYDTQYKARKSYQKKNKISDSDLDLRLPYLIDIRIVSGKSKLPVASFKEEQEMPSSEMSDVLKVQMNEEIKETAESNPSRLVAAKDQQTDNIKVSNGTKKTGNIEKKESTSGIPLAYTPFSKKHSIKDILIDGQIVVIGIIPLILMINNFIRSSALNVVSVIMLPISLFIYFKFGNNPAWFCQPSTVGWICTIVGMCLLVMTFICLWEIVKHFFHSLVNAESIGDAVVSLIGLILYGGALYAIIYGAMIQLIIAAIISLLGKTSKTSTKRRHKTEVRYNRSTSSNVYQEGDTLMDGSGNRYHKDGDNVWRDFQGHGIDDNDLA